MKVYRKPETAEWYYNSAQLVCDYDLTTEVEPWTDSLRLTFDATKDKTGYRHTTIRIDLREKEIEHLYGRLIQGRKKQLREEQKNITYLESEIVKLEKKIERTSNAVNRHVGELDGKWSQTPVAQTPVGSDEEAVWEKLRTPLRKLLDNRYGA